jgi:hypothetical protein
MYQKGTLRVFRKEIFRIPTNSSIEKNIMDRRKAWILFAFALSLSCCGPMPPPVEHPEEITPLNRISYDSNHPQAGRGFFQLAIVRSPLPRGDWVPGDWGIRRLCEALLEFTDFRINLVGGSLGLSFADECLHQVPVICISGPSEKSDGLHLSRYLLEGGFFIDMESSRFPNSVKNALREREGLVEDQDFSTRPLSNNHPIFTSYYYLKELSTEKEDSLPQLNGFFIRDRLVGVFTEDRWVLWDPTRRPETSAQPPDLQQQMAFNVMIYALTQEGSMLQHLRGNE